jgi:hypothetical protein
VDPARLTLRPTPNVVRRSSLCLAAAAALLAARSAPAQTTPAPRRAVSQGHAWLQYFGEHRLDRRWALLYEAQLRRADVAGRTPQQLLLRPGLLYQLGGGASVAAGYAYAASSVYGEAPAAAPSDEHRIWEQLQFGSRTGPVSWTHRFRAEQRFLGQRVREADGDFGRPDDWRYRDRLRAFTRATVDAPALGVALPRAYLTSFGELFLNAGASADGQIFDQSRLALQAGWRLTPRMRAEAGYMQQFVQRGGSRVSESNHTLLVSLFLVTGAR